MEGQSEQGRTTYVEILAMEMLSLSYVLRLKLVRAWELSKGQMSREKGSDYIPGFEKG
jgi:hypothetical protein